MSGVLPPGASPGSAAPADPGEQAVQHDDGQPRGYFIGGCGHRRSLWPSGHLDPCKCDLDPPDPRSAAG